MKLKQDDIKIKEKNVLKNGKGFVEKVQTLQEEHNLYFEMLDEYTEYKVYMISEKTYNKAVSGYKIEQQDQEYIGTMAVDEDEYAIIMRLQKKYKVFGKIGGVNDKTKEIIVLSCIVFAGLVMMLIGGWKVINNKNVLARRQATEGVITSISTNRLMGKRYAEGYYDIHVKYSVNGKTYEGYNGTTANQVRVGEKINVHYDSKHPEKIIIADDMNRFPFVFIYIGAIVTVVGTTILITAIRTQK